VKQVVIENPVINSPFREPGRHFKFTDEGIINEVIDGCRTSLYFVPIAQPRKKDRKQTKTKAARFGEKGADKISRSSSPRPDRGGGPVSRSVAQRIAERHVDEVVAAHCQH
jgi:hypothetical protein